MLDLRTPKSETITWEINGVQVDRDRQCFSPVRWPETLTVLIKKLHQIFQCLRFAVFKH